MAHIGPMGPNLKKLAIHKMSLDAIPPGGGLHAGIKFLTEPHAMTDGWHNSIEWCNLSIQAIRDAAEPNPWRESSEEEIAGELLRRIEERKR
jgi:hypothetical protein